MNIINVFKDGVDVYQTSYTTNYTRDLGNNTMRVPGIVICTKQSSLVVVQGSTSGVVIGSDILVRHQVYSGNIFKFHNTLLRKYSPRKQLYKYVDTKHYNLFGSRYSWYSLYTLKGWDFIVPFARI